MITVTTLFRLLALMLLFVPAMANRGSKLDQSAISNEKPFGGRPGWGVFSNKDKSVKEVKNTKEKKPVNVATTNNNNKKESSGVKSYKEIDELMDGFE